MFEQRAYLTVPNLTVPSSSVDRIRLVSEGQFEETVRVAEYAVLREVVEESNRLLDKDGFRIKPDANVGNTNIVAYMNCTDTVLTQMAICKSMGLKTAAMFTNGHASTIVGSAEDGSYWHLGGDIVPNVKSSTMLDAVTDRDKIKAIEIAFGGLKKQTGAYLYKDMDNRPGSWQISSFKGTAIRKASPLGEPGEVIEGIYAPTIIVDSSLANRMLHAIDVLGMLNGYKTNDEVLSEFTVAKKKLRSLTPKLSK